MKKKITRITKSQLSEMIKDITMQCLNEMDGKTYSRIYNDTHRAKEENQLGKLNRDYIINQKDGNNIVSSRTKSVLNDDIISRGRKMESTAQQRWLKDFIGQTFKFYGEDRMGLVADILFTFQKVIKLERRKTILIGDVVFNETQINGDGIIIDFEKSTVKYHERGNRFAYSLEIDNRTKPLWDKLLKQLKMALDNRKP